MNILVVEDVGQLLDVEADILTDAGHQVAKAANGHEALRLLGKGQHFDLILLDLMMPVVGGKAFLQQLRKLPAPQNGTPVVVVSALLRTDAAELHDLGVSDVLLKPIDLEDLLAAVHRYQP